MRIANRLLAFIVAAALVVTGVTVIVEVIAARTSSAPVIIGWHSILRWGQRNTWNATSVELACAVTAAIGALLLLPQLRRRRPTRLTLATGDPATDVALTRKGVVIAVGGTVSDIEGISEARVKVRHHRILVNAVSSAATKESAHTDKSAVTEAAQGAINELRLTAHKRLRVTVATRKKAGN